MAVMHTAVARRGLHPILMPEPPGMKWSRRTLIHAIAVTHGLSLLLLSVVAVLTPSVRVEASSPAAGPRLPSATSDLPPYAQRGNQVATRYRAYTAQLDMFYDALRALLTQEAPDLVTQLKSEPPQPIIYGYQILPTLAADKPFPATAPRATSTAYSWGRTDKLLDAEHTRLASLQARLQALSSRSGRTRRPIYQHLVAEYLQLEENRQLIDHHLQYNRFWQPTIAADKARFDRLTRLHDAVLERQAIRDTLQTTLSPDVVAALHAHEQALTNRIAAHSNRITPLPFLTVRHPHPHLWAVQVPLYTDIQDQKLLHAYKEAIETVWRVTDGDTEFRIQVLFKPVHPRHLYKPNAPPAPGAHIDIDKHVARFPTDGGVLTTGASITYALPGRYVALGPQELSANILAHEFGHILGFVDGYFRGYRDLGTQGYEVLEIVPNATDIMYAPASGKALRAHFDRLMAGNPHNLR